MRKLSGSIFEYLQGKLFSDFVRESNRIEGILRDPTEAEIEAHRLFIALKDTPTIEHLCVLVGVLQPDARLRNIPGLDVYVGDHVPPKGGPQIQTDLLVLLERVASGTLGAYEVHRAYETLHPFTDGNGRSGRALWAWMMARVGYDFSLGFLHLWYYQSLRES